MGAIILLGDSENARRVRWACKGGVIRYPFSCHLMFFVDVFIALVVRRPETQMCECIKLPSRIEFLGPSLCQIDIYMRRRHANGFNLTSRTRLCSSRAYVVQVLRLA